MVDEASRVVSVLVGERLASDGATAVGWVRGARRNRAQPDCESAAVGHAPTEMERQQPVAAEFTVCADGWDGSGDAADGSEDVQAGGQELQSTRLIVSRWAVSCARGDECADELSCVKRMGGRLDVRWCLPNYVGALESCSCALK